MGHVSREAMIEQSLQDLVRGALVAGGWTAGDKTHVLDSFPFDRLGDDLDRNYVAMGFSFDDGGKQGECGSSLIIRIDTIEVYVFATTEEFGKNLASAVKVAIEGEAMLIPLKAIDQPGQPVIDQLIILEQGGIRVERIVVVDPRPWERYCWVVRVKVQDEYYSDAA